MSKQIEALKLALEALKDARTFTGAWPAGAKTISAIRDALAEPEEKYRYGTPLLDAMTGNAEQPAQQEWPKPKFVRNVDGVPCITLVEHEYLMRSRTPPPASKPLTDAQIGAVAADIWGSILIAPQSYQAFARSIEAKLREKNQ